jgi:hypothetical protein
MNGFSLGGRSIKVSRPHNAAQARPAVSVATIPSSMAAAAAAAVSGLRFPLATAPERAAGLRVLVLTNLVDSSVGADASLCSEVRAK